MGGRRELVGRGAWRRSGPCGLSARAALSDVAFDNGTASVAEVLERELARAAIIRAIVMGRTLHLVIRRCYVLLRAALSLPADRDTVHGEAHRSRGKGESLNRPLGPSDSSPSSRSRGSLDEPRR